MSEPVLCHFCDRPASYMGARPLASHVYIPPSKAQQPSYIYLPLCYGHVLGWNENGGPEVPIFALGDRVDADLHVVIKAAAEAVWEGHKAAKNSL